MRLCSGYRHQYSSEILYNQNPPIVGSRLAHHVNSVYIMPTEIMIATGLFTLALFLYSTAIWSGRKSSQLKVWQIVVFFLGVSSDALGVWITIEFIGAIVFTPHAIFGFTALLLMSLHFFWMFALFVTCKPQTPNTHRLSLLVWTVWMLSYLSGLVSGLEKVL